MQSNYLLRYCKQYEGESLYSIIYRNAINLGFDHPSSMLKEISVHLYTSSCNYYDDDQKSTILLANFLSRIKGLEIDSLTLNKWNNILFSKGKPNKTQKDIYFYRYKSKFCPHCLQEKFYHHLIWDVSFVTVCNIHKTYLIDKCQKCNSKIYHSRLMRDKCKCGFSLSESEIKACHSVPVLKSQEVFQDLLTGNKNKVTLNTNDISAKEFFELFGHFGYLISGIPSNVLDQSSTIQKIAFSKRLATRDIEMLTLMTRVIYQLIVYPSLHFVNVMAFIDREMKKYQPELYRNRQARLKKIVNHPSGMFYQEQLIRYFENNRSLNDTKRTIVKGQKLNNSYIGIGEAKAITKIDHASVEKLIEINALKTYPTIDGKSFVLKREEVENLLKVKKECIGLNVIIKDLEIRFQNIIRIIDRGKIEVFHGPGKDGYYNWLIEEVNYKKYKDKLFQNTKLVEEVDESWITFSQSVFKVRNWGVSFEDLLELVENGEVTSVLLKNRQSLKGLYILKTDVEHIVKVKQSQIIESNGYATKKLIKVLKMGQPKIERLIDKGVLKVTHQQKNENGTITRFISKDQIIDYLMCSRGWNKKVVEDYLAINSGYR